MTPRILLLKMWFPLAPQCWLLWWWWVWSFEKFNDTEGGDFSGSAFLRNCPSYYPGGIQEARKDFGRTQTILTISLTFYQFALVGDRNDDRHYNADELRDILESMNLPFNTILPSPLHATTLNDTFDSLHHMENLDQLVTGMGRLLDQGYRLTGQDQLALNRIMG